MAIIVHLCKGEKYRKWKLETDSGRTALLADLLSKKRREHQLWPGGFFYLCVVYRRKRFEGTVVYNWPSYPTINLKNNTATITDPLARQKGFEFTLPETKASIRTLPLSQELVAELKAYCTKQKEMLLRSGIAWKDEMTVVSNSIGGPTSHNCFWKEYKSVVCGLGLESTGCHDAWRTRLKQMTKPAWMRNLYPALQGILT